MGSDSSDSNNPDQRKKISIKYYHKVHQIKRKRSEYDRTEKEVEEIVVIEEQWLVSFFLFLRDRVGDVGLV